MFKVGESNLDLDESKEDGDTVELYDDEEDIVEFYVEDSQEEEEAVEEELAEEEEDSHRSAPIPTSYSTFHPFPPVHKHSIVVPRNNISTLQCARDERIIPPDRDCHVEIDHILNTLSMENILNVCSQLKSIASYSPRDYWNWISHHLVIEKISKQPQKHILYLYLLSNLNEELFGRCYLESMRNIHVILQSVKLTKNVGDRSQLKSLGHWLGLVSYALGNGAIAATESLDMTSLIVEAVRKKSQMDLFYVVPFVLKFIAAAAACLKMESQSRATESEEYLSRLLSLLTELYDFSGDDFDIPIRVKFEIDKAFAQFKINRLWVKPSNILAPAEYEINDYQLTMNLMVFHKFSYYLDSKVSQPKIRFYQSQKL